VTVGLLRDRLGRLQGSAQRVPFFNTLERF
jgi:hypothetical protein